MLTRESTGFSPVQHDIIKEENMEEQKQTENLMEKIVALCKRRGFIFPGSDIYGGITGMWDYGPAGSLMRKNIKDLWWKEMVQLRDDMVGVDAAIIMNPRAWDASGHTSAFTDPLVECKICHLRFREDKPEEISAHENTHKGKQVEWTEPMNFNLLVKTYLGVIEGKQSEVFLRGEITNGVTVNFKNVMDSTRVKIPFGIAQIGKAFRNEITPGGFIFRDREFEQMESQFFIKPIEEEGMKWFEYWKQNRMDWYASLGLKKEHLQFKDHEKLAHYAKAATDVEYKFPWGFDEIAGIHHRSDWDLSRHQEYSGQNLKVRDNETNEEFTPWDIETSGGVDRLMLALLADAYNEDEKRVWLALHPKVAPYKAAIFPLLGNKPELIDKAREIYKSLQQQFYVNWDDRGNIGKRYAAQDEIGTPFCITVDFDTLTDEMVTVRDRDSATQERIKIDNLTSYIQKSLS
jgi:glycyl-tRNA synthetase